VRLLQRAFAGWPLKLTSVLLALLLWVIATLEEPVTRRVPARLTLDPPADRAVTSATTTATVQLTAPAREFLKLGGRPVTVLRSIADSSDGPGTIALSPADVILPRGISARALDVQPALVAYRMIPKGGAVLQTRTWRGVAVAVPGTIERRWIPVPDTVTVAVRGPAARLATLDLDSVVVLVRPDTATGAATLRAIVPPGFTAETVPQAIRLVPRSP
jgi:hypothetical protein